MEKVKFYRCAHCGKIEVVFEGEEKNLICCGEPMSELKANSTDAANEKHVPVCKIDGENVVVTVGEVEHPMEVEHYITWIAQVFENTIDMVKLSPNQKPEASFKNAEGAEYYAYCNKHGLWKNRN